MNYLTKSNFWKPNTSYISSNRLKSLVLYENKLYVCNESHISGVIFDYNKFNSAGNEYVLIDSLTSTNANEILSANQGRILGDRINVIDNTLSSYGDIVNYNYNDFDPLGSAQIAENNAINYANNIITSVYKHQGKYNPEITNQFPTTSNTIGNVAIKSGFIWIIELTSTQHSFLGITVETGDTLTALVDNPFDIEDWHLTEKNLGYIPENSVNKVINLNSPSNITYPTSLAVSDEFNLVMYKSEIPYSISTIDSNEYTVSANDFTVNGRKIIKINNTLPINVYINTPLSLNVPHGYSLNIRQSSNGNITLIGINTATLEGNVSFNSQHEIKTIIAETDTNWLIVG